MWRDLLLRAWRRSVSQKKIEALDHEAESHDRNAGAHPGEKGTLVGGMIAVTFYHRTAPARFGTAALRCAVARIARLDVSCAHALCPTIAQSGSPAGSRICACAFGASSNPV